MTISTYATLKTAIASWLNKSNLTSVIPDFVQVAEAYIRRDLKVRSQELTATGTLTGTTLAFPSRFAMVRRLVVDDRQCKYITPEEYTRLDQAGYDLPARLYTIIGENIVILGGSSGDAYTLVYSEWFAALSADADTNWVLTNSPDIYLWSSLMAGAVYLKDVGAATGYKTLYDEAVKRLDDKEKEAKYGQPLVVRPETVE